MVNSSHTRAWMAGVLGGLGLAAAAIAPVAAAPAPQNCNQPNMTIGVAFVGASSANIYLAQRQDLQFEGPVTIRVYCVDRFGTDIGEVTDAMVAITTDVPNTSFDGQLATNPSSASLALPSGIKTVTVVSSDPGLPAHEYFAQVGRDRVTVVQAYGSAISATTSYDVRSIYAATPELGSLALFATGLLGAAGYARTRLRTRRGR